LSSHPITERSDWEDLVIHVDNFVHCTAEQRPDNSAIIMIIGARRSGAALAS